MYESHASYSACGLGSDGTDRLVALAREAGVARGIYGAKITGGGSGGTVAVLADAGARDTVRDIARRYGAETGRDTLRVRRKLSGSGAHRGDSALEWSQIPDPRLQIPTHSQPPKSQTNLQERSCQFGPV